VFDTIGILNGGQTVGYSHRGGGHADPIPARTPGPSDRVMTRLF
jgi:hypothetical protein